MCFFNAKIKKNIEGNVPKIFGIVSVYLPSTVPDFSNFNIFCQIHILICYFRSCRGSCHKIE